MTPSGGRGVCAVARLRRGAVSAATCSGVKPSAGSGVELNGPFKEVCTRWQLEDRPAECVAELRRLHERLSDVLARLVPRVPRFDQYPLRLDRSLARLEAGDSSAFVQPLTESYHDIWMELHQDFLLSLDRQRTEADGT